MHMHMHMFMCMRTTARGAARRGSSRRPLQKGQEIETGQQRHRLVETDPLSLTSFLSNTNAQAGAREVLAH